MLIISTFVAIRFGARLFRIGLVSASRPKLSEILRQARLNYTFGCPVVRLSGCAVVRSCGCAAIRRSAELQLRDRPRTRVPNPEPRVG